MKAPIESSIKIAGKMLKGCPIGTCPFNLHVVTCADLRVNKDGTPMKSGRSKTVFDRHGITLFLSGGRGPTLM